MRHLNRRRLTSAVVAAFAAVTLAQPSPAFAATIGNPVLPGDRPDPTIELFNGAYYIYTTASGGTTDAAGRYFYAFKSYDMKNWFNAGVVLDRATVGWAPNDGRTWAPDMVARNGKYYFYSAIATSVAVAVCDTPVGPCVDRGSPLVQGQLFAGVEAIDPMVFIDDNGQAYLYFGGSAGGGNMGIFKLNADMTTTSGAVIVQRPTNYTEGSFVFKRNGVYYLQYSNGTYNNNTYNVQYSTGPSATGPWTYRGQLLSTTGNYNGPGHNAVLNYPGTDDWYMVYHRFQGGNFSVRYTAIDRMYFNADGTIQRVNMTDVGVEQRLAPGGPNPIPATPPQIVITPGTKCLDVSGNDNGVAGAAVQIWDCLPGAVDQKWTWNGQTLRTLGRCLDITGGSFADFAKLELWDCNGNPVQNWVQQTDGSLRNPGSGKCLDTSNGDTNNGARIQIYTCNGNVAQKFVIGR